MMIRAVLTAVMMTSLIWPVMAQADVLCPDTTNQSDLAVKSMSDVQFDIDRLGLCLERAQLLQKLDETVRKREELRLKPMGLDGNLTTGTGLGALPPMPTLSASKIAIPALEAVKEPVPAIIQQDWKIQRIWGQGSGMQAQLVRDDVIANVKSGDILPTGERIAEVSVRGVILDGTSGRKPLVWFDSAKKTTETDSSIVSDKMR